MKRLIYIDTGKECSVGDIVKFGDEFYKVLSTEYPKCKQHVGRVTIKPIAKPFGKTYTFVPRYIGAEWVDDC